MLDPWMQKMLHSMQIKIYSSFQNASETLHTKRVSKVILLAIPCQSRRAANYWLSHIQTRVKSALVKWHMRTWLNYVSIVKKVSTWVSIHFSFRVNRDNGITSVVDINSHQHKHGFSLTKRSLFKCAQKNISHNVNDFLYFFALCFEKIN